MSDLMMGLPLPYSLNRNTRGLVQLTGFDEHALHLSGQDNYLSPVQGFADKLGQADDEEYLRIASEAIWLSAYAANNSKSDYHWQASACYYEARRRGDENLYQRAYDMAKNG